VNKYTFCKTLEDVCMKSKELTISINLKGIAEDGDPKTVKKSRHI
jgi:hypothetical protein